ncbi:MAG: hypothetical protein H6844_16160 [Alphaproteobacteria bacterium]|nr:hypothetical protein [Alphaproteobacteria bacterium]
MSPKYVSLRQRLLAGTAFVAMATALPAGAAFATVASVDLDFATGVVQSQDFGSVVSQNNAALVTATSSGSSAVLNLLDNTTADITYSGAYSVINNAIDATGTGNTSTSAVNLNFTPGLGTDSAAVGSFQTNGGAVSATSTGDQHTVMVLNSDPSFENILSGTLTFTNNDIGTNATANDASASIALANGVNLDGNGAPAAVAIDETLAAATDSATDGDLLVSSAQQTTAVTSASTSSASVTASLESLLGATVTLANSDVGASANGNTLAGDITSTDSTASIAASSAVTGLQDVGADVTSSNTGTTIQVQAGNVVDLGGTVSDSSVAVTSNTITSGSTGNASNQSIDLTANQILGSGTALVTDSDTAATDVQLAVTGAEQAVASVQTVGDTVAVVSNVAGGLVGLNVYDSNFTTPNSELTVLSNTIESTATGSSAVNGLSLTAGSTVSAPGAVAAVQSIDGDVSASVATSSVTLATQEDTTGSTLVTAGNTIRAAVTGASTANDIAVTTDILSLDTSNGGVSILADATTGDTESPRVAAGFALANDQSIGGTLSGPTASLLTASATGVQVLTTYAANSADVFSSTVHNGGYVDATGAMVEPGNTLVASVIGSTADNGIALSFTDLQGDVTGDGEVVAATANSQVVQGDSALTATLLGTNGEPVKTYVNDQVSSSTVTTSYNTVAVSGVGNRTTGNSVTVSATNAVIPAGIAASSAVDAATGDVTASAAFVAASSQEFQNSSISASQSDGLNPSVSTLSNTIDTEINGTISNSSVATAQNTLSATATANSASNGVFLGTDATSSIQASSAVTNYQDVTAAAVSATIGVLGTDAINAYTSSNGSNSQTGAFTYNSGTGDLSVIGSPVTFTFGSALSTEEAEILTALGWTATAGSTSVTVPVGNYNIVGSLSSISFNDPTVGSPGSGDESFSVAGFDRPATPAQLNGAGVTITAFSPITGSQLDVTANTLVGEVKGNTATNTLAVTGTALITNTAAQPTYALNPTLSPAGADNVLTNVQTVDAASALASDVAGSFGIIEPNDLAVTGSSLSVSDNLQQSYATANTGTNTLSLNATTTGVGAALVNDQTVSTAGVATTSDLDVAANAGVASSDLALDGNRNQSVATGNLETSTLNVSATNVDGPAGVGGLSSTLIGVLVGDSVLSSEQTAGATTVSASATTDVFNRDGADPSAQIVSASTLSFSRNQTTAQATGNSSTQDANLGDGATASYDAGSVVYSAQDFSSGAAVTATTNTEVGLNLTSDDTYDGSTILASTVAVDGNTASALARGNVGTTTLDVTATNSTIVAGTDALVGTATGPNASGGFLAVRVQNAIGATVTANSSATAYTLSALQTTGSASTDAAVEASTLSLSDNASAATAVANTSATTMRVGGDSMSNLDASAGVLTAQFTAGTVTATGGLTATATFDVGVGAGADAVIGSSLAVDGNTSSSSATGNVTTASLSADATNVTAGTGAAGVVDSTSESILATFGLATYQSNAAVVTSTNTANTIGLSVTGTALDAVESSTLSLSGNGVNAYATGNTSSNAVALGSADASSIDASAGLHNRQDNGGAVAASASGTFTVEADTGTVGSALNASTASLSGNSVLALARGNLANNGLTVDATATTNGGGGALFATGLLTASYGLLNEQSNVAAVDAISSGTSYAVVLNGTTGTGTGASGSTASLSGNTITAAGYGNIATNSLMLSSLNAPTDDASAMIANLQSNVGAVSATVTGGFAGVTVNGAATSSTVSVGSNRFSASAVGNFATSTMTRN